jgi:putative ABC transport system permease protein
MHLRMFDDLRHDLVLARRHLVRGGLATTAAIVSLGVGIAANTTVFSLVHALAFPHLIYPGAARIVFLESRNDGRGIADMMMSAPDARDVAQASRTLAGTSLAASQSSILRVGEDARRVQGRRVDREFFALLQVQPSLGRALRADDEPGAIVLSDALWRSQFGADRGVVDRAVRLDGGTATVVGVMPPLFDGDAEFWTPVGDALSSARRDDRQYDVFARLAPATSLGEVNAELAGLSARLAGDHASTNRGWQLYAVPLARLHGRDSRGTFLLLQAAVACVLLIACANIANILLARGTGRRREMAVRVAVGATRPRLVRALLTESLVLAAAGGALGVILAMWGIRAARSLIDFPEVIEPQLNTAVLAFSAVVSIVTGILCGVAPALRTSSVDPEPVLREQGRGGTDRRAGRLQALLVVAQMACAVLLATSAALLVRSVANRERVSLGFDPHGAFRAELALPYERYSDSARAESTIERITAAVAESPDVIAAGAHSWALPTGAGAQRAFTLPDRPADAPSPGGSVEAITPGYFAALGTSLMSGRDIAAGDRAGAAPVAVVNQQMANRLWPGQPAVGRRLRLGTAAESAPVVTIVGVVANVRRSPMHEIPIATVYLPYAQYPNSAATLVVRVRGDVASGVRVLTGAIHTADPLLLAEKVRTLDQDIAAFTAPLRATTSVLSVFAVTAVLLAAFGVFATMSYNVSERQHEIAIRSALGAPRDAIVRMVLTRALRLIAIGVLIGALSAAWATRALHAFLFGVTPLDSSTYVAVAAGLIVVAIAACWRPARQAAGIDPLAVLKG